MGFIAIKPLPFGRICLELLPSIMLKGDGWKQLKNTGDEVMIEGGVDMRCGGLWYPQINSVETNHCSISAKAD